VQLVQDDAAPGRRAGEVTAALEAGTTLFDTADIYGSRPGESEERLDAALAGRRDDVVVAAKFGRDMRGAAGAVRGARGSRRYIRRAAEGSLRRLATDRIDLVVDAHWTARTRGITPFASVQDRCSLLDRAIEREVVSPWTTAGRAPPRR
jgi:aryl-alcohol dehydrogenase-like predicted oxidoreductase